jgi:hypothetical protein
MSDTIVVFTCKTVGDILEAGGSLAWKVSKARALKMKYLVCTRNSNQGVGREPHRAGFLIGLISGFTPAPDEPDRYLIQISEWASIDLPEVWNKQRFPLHYANLAELGIDPRALKFKRVPLQENSSAASGRCAHRSENLVNAGRL